MYVESVTGSGTKNGEGAKTHAPARAREKGKKGRVGEVGGGGRRDPGERERASTRVNGVVRS